MPADSLKTKVFEQNRAQFIKYTVEMHCLMCVLTALP